MDTIPKTITKGNTLEYLTGDNHGYIFRGMKTESFADRLKTAMDYRNMSQAALAEAAGMSQPSVWKIASGKSKTSKKALDIANALNVNADWLLNGVGSMLKEDSPHAREDSAPYMSPGYNEFRFVKFWDGEQPTDSYTAVPNSLPLKNPRAYKLKYDTGYDELPAGSIVVLDLDEQPGRLDYVMADINNSYSVYKFLPGNAGKGQLIDTEPRSPLIDVDGVAVKIVGVVVYISRLLRT
ncbi:helix-turn-helix domain-containing protein [Dickeya fangzhongdai]|uniref:helix-turn-helix domain-containing protein n=1 Tax=Dickeya fangzhongdai TaxID=1778540 RepID=UPI001ADBE24E|nr:helix-turn-helix transcriptional regulator [Dickeya fangzhongdai]MBO8132486.1 helix-turn-helix transcriptional regulator [Dickeya fangzhongdai]